MSAQRGARGTRSLARLYEHRDEPLLPRGRFLRRLAAHAAVALAFVAGSLVIGMAGYASTWGTTSDEGPAAAYALTG